METVDGDTSIAAWAHWLEVTNEQESSLFVQLTGCVFLGRVEVTSEQASRLRHMAGPNYHAYIKALLAKRIADTETVVAGK